MSEKLPPICITYSANDWYVWAEDIPMTKLTAKDRIQATKQGSAIAQESGREWGGKRHTPKQLKTRRRKKRQRRQIKLARLESDARGWAEECRYTWANRANWTDEDWNNYSRGILPDDLEDHFDDDEDDCFGVAVGAR